MKIRSLLCAAAVGALIGGAAPALAQAQPSDQTDPATPGPASAAPVVPESGDIVVTARRQQERIQDVPVAVSVLSPSVLESKGTFNPVDLVQSVPGLAVTASISDRNNLTYTIRGQGFSYGTLFPAVITYFNEVPITQLTAGQFFDLSNVQVLRGPQGVSFGRVTDGGNVLVSPQKPKNEFGGYVSAKLGDYSSKVFDGALNIPLIADKVLLRGAFEIGRRDGFTTNLANGQDLDNVRYESYRVGLTIKPVDWIENYSVVSYQRTHDNGTGVVQSGVNPTALASNAGGLAFLFAGGYGIDAVGNVVPFRAGLTPFTGPNFAASQVALVTAQQARGPRAVSYTSPSFDNRKNLYVVNTTTINLSDSFQLKNIFGYVDVKDDEASNYGAANGAAVLTCHSACGTGASLPFNTQRQLSDEVRLAGKAFDNKLTFAIGAYFDKQKPSGAFENDTINVAILERDGVQYSRTTSSAVYGTAEYEIVPNLTVNGGVRYTHDTVNSSEQTYLRPIDGGQAALLAFLQGPFGGNLSPAIAQFVVNATFAPIPHGQCVNYGAGSVLYPQAGSSCLVYHAAFNATTWAAGLDYKPSRDTLLYGKVSRGYRPGGVNGTAPPGSDPTYNPEFDTSVEIGAKADLRFGGMRLNTAIAAYHDRYTNIIKNVVIPGGVPVSLARNVDNATVQGVELEATLYPVAGLSIGGTFAYTDAKFDQTNSNGVLNGAGSCDPTAAAVAGFCSTNRFNSTPEGQFTIHADYTAPLGKLGEFSVGGVLYHQSSVALTDTSALNPNAIELPYTTLDIRAGLRNVLGYPVDLGFFMTNVTNKLYRIGGNDISQSGSLGVRGDIFAPPRMFGFSLKYRFGSDAR